MNRFHRKRQQITLLLSFFILVLTTPHLYGQSVPRIEVKEARAKVSSGKALLVCSYRDTHCKRMLLNGAILKSQLEARQASLPKDTEIIFYCA